MITGFSFLLRNRPHLVGAACDHCSVDRQLRGNGCSGLGLSRQWSHWASNDLLDATGNRVLVVLGIGIAGDFSQCGSDRKQTPESVWRPDGMAI